MTSTKKKHRIFGSFFKNTVDLSDTQGRVLNRFTYSIVTTTMICMLGIMLFYVFALASMYHNQQSGPALWLLSIFSDFVEIMNFSLDETPYIMGEGAGSSYPPIAIIILYPFALICKNVFAQYAHEAMDIDTLTSLVVRHVEFWIAIVLFFLVCITAIVVLASKIGRFGPIPSLKLSLIICCSSPFVYAIMRGNTIYFALIFVLLFLLFYNSDKPVLREIAYISLAIAGAIKIYPLFFGVLLLRKRRFFSTARVAIYFIIIFFLSFKFFPEQQGAMNSFSENLQGFMFDPERLACFRNLSITAMLYKLVSLFSPLAAESLAFHIVNIALLATVFTLSVITALYTRSDFSRLVICFTIIILIPSVTYFYVLIFAIIPFIEYLRSYDRLDRKTQRLYGFMFMFLLLTPLLLPLIYLPHAIVVLFMACREIYKVIKYELIADVREKKALAQ
ncbi:MAG: DUF2029 domain-containing protein [Ruminococcaceae bacterium]|nr:DUF2029 domain-containing protein [Oscillospiraceae bacterium]